MRWFLASLLLLIEFGIGVWADGLPPADAPIAIAVTPGHHWKVHRGDPDRLYLYWQGRQVGGYDKATQCYRPLLNYTHNTWGPPSSPPHPLPADFQAKQFNFGVDQDKISKQPKYRLNDREVNRAEAYKIVESGLEDDSQKYRLTIIGSERERQRVLNDFNASTQISGIRDQLIVRDYEPTHWHVQGAGFKCDGQPTIYLQTPEGKVLHRQDDYQGPDDLLVLLRALGRSPESQAIRKPNDSYQPALDPDLRRHSGATGTTWLALALALSVLMLASINLFRIASPSTKGHA